MKKLMNIIKKNSICFEKEDYKLKYEHELGIQRLESSIDICIAEINGLNDQLNLLRWLYQESEDNNAG